LERVIAIDVGYGQLKARAGDRELCIPSYVARDVRAAAGLGRLKGEVDVAVTDEAGRWWMVGGQAVDQALMPLSSSVADRADDPVFGLLLRAALAFLVEGEADVNLVIGLPPEQQQTGARDDLAARLTRVHDIECRINDREWRSRVNVKRVRIPPQAMGTFYDLLLDGAGDVRPEVIDTALYHGDKLIVDIGGGTTDLLGVSGLKALAPVTRTYRQGMQWVYGELRRLWRQMPLARVERAVLAGELDPAEQVGQLAAMIVSEIRNLLDVTGFRPDVVIITGGPAQLLRPHIHVGRAEVILGSDRSNVRGYLKWGLRPRSFAS
jgi:hypothetical protein